VPPVEFVEISALPLRSRTPPEWGAAVLADPFSLLIDHAFLEKKAATNALELLTRWPNEWLDGWVEAMTGVARDEIAHLAQVVRLLSSRGGRMDRFHKNPYANALRQLVRKASRQELLDRLLVAALIELRSCERFSVLAAASTDYELAGFYRTLFSSELGITGYFCISPGNSRRGRNWTHGGRKCSWRRRRFWRRRRRVRGYTREWGASKN
jgi:tRNA 2-(methylsulfanyl)-N6-isopentenyladenosine37 hydroxylase